MAALQTEQPEPEPQGTAEETTKRKRPNAAQVFHQFPIKNPQFTYLHLSLQTNPPSTDAVDGPTAMLSLHAALKQYLGLHGTAIPIDILKREGQSVWVRIPREDKEMFVAALSNWIGGGQVQKSWRVIARGDWLMGVVNGGSEGGRELFED